MVTRQFKTTAQISTEDTSALKDFFIDSLKDLYWAEKNLCKALPKMTRKATSKLLKTALENHLAETENQVVRLEQVFAVLDLKASAKKCEAIEGLIREADSIMSETSNGSMARDVAIIAAAQKVEHYEIASYGTIRTLADVLGYKEASTLLGQTLEEEKNADSILTRIAEGYLNESALKDSK